VQPFFRSASDLFAFLPQPGSLNTSWIVADSELIRLSYPQNGLPKGRANLAFGRSASPLRPISKGSGKAVVASA
jgi:hypothetical protein